MVQTAASAIRYTLILTSLLVSTPFSWGQSIGINFTTGRGSAIGTVTQAAGVESQRNWNNVSGVVRKGFVLRDSQGQTTVARLAWDSNNPWSMLGSSTSGGNDGMMNAYLDTTDSSITTVTVANVPYKNYKVIVYFDGDAQGRAGDYTVNGLEKNGLRDEGNWGFPGTLQEAANSGDAGNYSVWQKVSGATLTITAQASSNGGFRAPINAVQVVNNVVIAEPPSIGHGETTMIEGRSASIALDVEKGGPAAVTIYYGRSDGGSVASNWEDQLDVGSVEGSRVVLLDGLLPNQSYFFRARATNGVGSAWALATATFRTPVISVPSISLGDVGRVTGGSAQIAGSISDSGNDSPVIVLYYGPTDAGEDLAAWPNQLTVRSTGTGFTHTITGLDPLLDYVVRARAENAAGSSWAAEPLSFTTTDEVVPTILINEIHYAPSDPNSAEAFIELVNLSNDAVDLSGWQFANGVAYQFPVNASIAANGYLVVAENPATIAGQFGLNGVFGPWAGRLRKSGEAIELNDALGNLVDRVNYGVGFPWPTGAREGGGSAELIHPSLENGLGGSWRTSGAITEPEESVTYVSAASTNWRYRKGTSEPPSNWRDVESGTWFSGTTPIGYADGDDATLITDMSGNYTSLYFRKSFSVSPGPLPSALTLRVYVDDGAIIYLNGAEVGRFSVSPGPKAFDDLAQNHEAAWEDVTIGNAGSVLKTGTNVVAVHAMNSSLGSSDFSFDLELRTPLPGTVSGVPTPAARNSVYSELAPPQIRQVSHLPKQPLANEAVVISAKVTDPDGVAGVTLDYQIVAPGQYVRKSDAAYESGWQSTAMTPGLEPDTFQATLPASIQVHRRLLRYRITAEDALGESVLVPYIDDEQPNFAYYVYNGAPAWRGAFVPGQTAVQTFPAELMDDIPMYQLIARESDVIGSQYSSGQDGRHQLGTLIYDGEVYDHIEFENRGEASTYVSGKNKWRFHFNRAREFQARDSWGRKYESRWNKMSVDACTSPWAAVHRGMAGVEEAVSYRLYGLAGVPSSRTHHFHFRIVDDVQEASGSSQYEGDMWGLYLAVEDPDGSFLDDRGLPDGNVYKIESGATGDKKHQGVGQAANSSDWNSFRSASSRQTEAWWRANMDLPNYHSFHACNRIVGNVDLREGWNHYFYHRPDDRWMVLPWDLDMMFIPETHWSGTIQQKVCLEHPGIALELRNRCRELLDLMCDDDSVNGGQIGQLIDEYAQIVNPAGQLLTWADLDAAMWNMHPRTNGNANTHGGQTNHRGNFFYTPFSDSRIGGSWTRRLTSSDFEGFVDYLVKYSTDAFPNSNWAPGNGNPLGYGYEYLAQEARDSAIPNKPTVSYTGAVGFPVNDLQFASSAFSDPQGSQSFGAMEWRLAEIAAPGVGAYEPGTPRRYEVEPVWESGELTTQVRTLDLPTLATREGRAYRLRVRHRDHSQRWSHWSDPVMFTAAVPDLQRLAGQLRITEIMYHPAPATLQEVAMGFVESDFEYVELRNVSEESLDLTDIRFTKGIDFAFRSGFVLAPGAYVMVVANEAAFAFRYGDAPVVAGSFSPDRLSNAGEVIKLSFGAGAAIHEITYDDIDPWPMAADGEGYSLVLVDSPSENLAEPANWLGSARVGGSPGADEELIVIDRVILTTEAEGDGVINVSPPALDHATGATLTLTAVANQGWQFSQWSDLETAENPRTIVIETDQTVSARFVPIPTFAVTPTVGSGQGAVTLDPANDSYLEGETVQMLATPAAGHRFAGWVGDVESIENPLTLTVTQALAISANFVQQHMVTSSVSGSGSILRSPDASVLDVGTAVTLTAQPSPGFVFEGWTGDLLSPSISLELTVDRDWAVTANFVAAASVNVQVVGEGQVSRSPDSEVYVVGSIVTLRATPADGWAFARWRGDVAADTNPLEVTVAESVSAEAVFVKLHTLTVNQPVSGGEIAVSPEKASYTEGEIVTLSAGVDANHDFVAWTGDASGTELVTTIVMTGDRTVGASLVPLYSISVPDNINGGTVQVSPDQSTYRENTSITITAIPDPDYSFESWEADLNGQASSPLTLQVTGDLQVSARFEQDKPPYEQWQAEHFSEQERNEAAFIAPDADPDGDGVANLVEYVQSTNPVSARKFARIILTPEPGDVIELTTPFRTNDPAITWTIEQSSNLLNWSALEPEAATIENGQLTLKMSEISEGFFVRVRFVLVP